MQKLDDLSRDIWRVWAAKLLDDTDAQHLAEVIHERRTITRTQEASQRAPQPRAAPSRSWSYFPPPPPPQGPQSRARAAPERFESERVFGPAWI